MSSKTAIDLFCGAGGLSEGFRQAGYSVLAGNDYEAIAGKTYKETHPEAEFISGPVQNLTADRLFEVTGLEHSELDVLLGGPPCQAYSVYNHQRGVHDERASLFKHYLRLVRDLNPKWVVMENVTGITSIANGQIVETIKHELKSLGYDNVEAQVLRAEEYGVPQLRRRIFFIANRLGIPVEFPQPTHGPGLKPLTTIEEAICDLPVLANGEDASKKPYIKPANNDFLHVVRGNAVLVENHAAPKLGSINIERMKHIPIGGSWRDIPVELLPAGMRRAKRSDHTLRYGRMRPDGQSCTVLTKCDVHWGAYIHPYQDRAITVREAARLQSFPDHFVFRGSKTEQYTQVGNAVPPMLANAVARQILESEASIERHLPLAAAE